MRPGRDKSFKKYTTKLMVTKKQKEKQSKQGKSQSRSHQKLKASPADSKWFQERVNSSNKGM